MVSDCKRSALSVQGDGLVAGVRRLVEADSSRMFCQLAVRNINIIYIGGGEAKDVAFYRRPGQQEVRNLGDDEAASVRGEVGDDGGEWVKLVGYDGGVKMVVRRLEEFRWEEVFDRIDRMPMRRKEISSGAVCP